MFELVLSERAYIPFVKRVIKLKTTFEGEYAIAKQIRDSENHMRKKPTEKDYRTIISFLADFCIKVDRKDIPEFSSRTDLSRWKLKVIKEGGIKVD